MIAPSSPQPSCRVAIAVLATLTAFAPGCSWFGHKQDDPSASIRSGNAGAAASSTASSANQGELMKRAEQAKASGDTEEAIRLLAAAIEKNPTLTVAHVEIGDLLLEKNDPAKAEPHFAAAAQQQPSNFDAQFKHGYALQLLNRLSESVRAYLRALSIRPDDFQANQNLATAYLQLNEPAAALPYSQRATELQSTSGPAHANLGSVYASLDRHDEAVREYRTAAELMELTPQLLLNLSESLGKLNRYEEMAATLDQLVATQPSAQSFERLGYARFKQRQFVAAKEAFNKAITLDAAHYPAYNGLGVCLLNDYIASNRTDDRARNEALKLLKTSLRINKGQPRIVELVSRYQ